MARASTWTLLALDRYAAIMGIVPPHFNSGYGVGTNNVTVFPVSGCTHIWWQYAWQASGAISREDLAEEIARAEEEIATQLGYWPGPVWVSQELHRFPRHFDPSARRYGAQDAAGRRVGLKARWGKVIAPGRRQADEEELATAVGYSDVDLDGFPETATVSFATTLTDPDEIKIFFAGHSGEPEWEIRPARTKTISAVGLFTATFYTWQCVNPDRWEAFPAGEPGAELDLLNLSTAGNRILTADAYRVYNDTTETSATFYWEPEAQDSVLGCSLCGGAGCAACALTTQNGCLHVRDAHLGIVVPQPATYSAAAGAWAQDSWAVCEDPQMAQIWYYCGDMDERYLRGAVYDPLPEKWARAIAYLATARLERPFCDCSNLTAYAQSFREDMSKVGPAGSWQLTLRLLDNPFGTKRGEIMAWQIVDSLTKDKIANVTAIG